MKEIPGEKLVFLDESGVNTNLIRRYGRSVGKTRVVDHAPFSTPKSTTVLSAIRQDGQFACMTFEGGTTKERFKEYLETVLLILSILVDTFFTRISMPKQHPEIHSISVV